MLSRRTALPPSSARRLAVIGLLLVEGAALGCGGSLRKAFPRREDVFKPVESTLGEERVVNGDTSYVLRGPGYELYARDRDALPDGQDALDQASASFRRFFSQTPPVVAVELRDSDRDTLALGANGRRAVVLATRRPDERQRRGFAGSGVPTGPLVRAWLAARVDDLAGRVPPTTAASPTVVPAGGRAPGTRGWRDDARVPDWLETALPALVTDAPATEFLTQRLADAPDRLLPLATLFASSRPTATRDSGLVEELRDGRQPRGRLRGAIDRRGNANAPLAGALLFDAQALSIAQFIRQREGPAFLGTVTDALLRGGSVAAVLPQATTLPKTVDALDTAWRAWLRTEREDSERRRGR
jgi:hypothetical protein